MTAFRPADRIAHERGMPIVRVNTTACVMCGEAAEPICWDCLGCTIEEAIERMAREGKLDDAILRVIERMRG